MAYFAISMKWTLALFALAFMACDSKTDSKSETEPQEKTAREVDHRDEISFSVDTVISGVVINYRLEPIPNYYVVTPIETETSREAHIYRDQRLVVKIDEDSIVITKDSLLRDINQEFLNEAILQHLQPISINPENGTYVFEYGPGKPFEDFFYRYELNYANGKWDNRIADK